MKIVGHISIFCFIGALAAVSAADSDDIITGSDDITARCDDITISRVLERLAALEERDRQHQKVNAAQQAEIDALKTQLHIQSSQGSLARRRKGVEQPVAFYARVSHMLYNLTRGQQIVFDQELTNVDNSYNNSTGTFFTPMPGIYVFSVTLMIDNRDDTHAGIYVNGALKTYIKLYGTEHQYDTMTQMAVFVLKQGDVVDVRHTESNKSIHNNYSYFSGFLLYQDYDRTLSVIG